MVRKKARPAAAPAPAPAAPAAARRRAPAPAGGDGVYGWAAAGLLLLGVLPLVLVFLPVLLPPGAAVVSGRATMVGGGGLDGALGIYSVAHRFGAGYCAEHGAVDTVRCYVALLKLGYGVLMAPPAVDFYTALPMAAYTTRAAEYKDAGCPLYVGPQDVEAAVDADGAVAAQIARYYLEARGASASRLLPLTTDYGALAAEEEENGCLADRLEATPCHAIFPDVFGADRAALFGAELFPCGAAGGGAEARRAALEARVAAEVWGGRPRKTFYVFGMRSAERLVRSIPQNLPAYAVVNVVMLPLADRTATWRARTRGRAACDDKFFHDSYDLTYRYFRWVVEGNGQPAAATPRL